MQRRWTAIIYASVIVVWLTLFFANSPTSADAPIAISGIGTPAEPEQTTTYRLTLTHSEDVPIEIDMMHMLPLGFSYQPNSTMIRINGQTIPTTNPLIQDRQLLWSGLDIPAATYVSHSHFGIHTFVQDLCVESYVDFQLDKALELVGAGGYVKQMFYSIKTTTTGPKDCWNYFVSGAYDRHLIPIIRLQGSYDASHGYWVKPEPDVRGDYGTIAQAYRRVVEGLPRRDGQDIYVEVWNEPELPVSWSNAANAQEYGDFFVDVAAAIREIGDPRIKVMNGALTPGNASFAEELMRVSGFAASFDLWAAHCYPYNHPPHYNIHSGSARYPEFTIDSYLLELGVLARHGRGDVSVILTETGHGLGDAIFAFEGYSPINETNRAAYIADAFEVYWAHWQELQAVCPYELVGPYGDWGWLDWLYPTTDIPHEQYRAVAALPKPPLELNPAVVDISFRAYVPPEIGTYYSTLEASIDGVTIVSIQHTAPVQVLADVPEWFFPLVHKESVTGNVQEKEEHEPETSSFSTVLDGIPQYTILKSQTRRTGNATGANLVHTISLNVKPVALAVNATGTQAFISTRDSKLVHVNLESGSIESVVDTDMELEAIALDEGREARLYGVNAESDIVAAIDANSGRLLESAFLVKCNPIDIAIDSQTGRIYTACASDGTVRVFDRKLNPVKCVQVADRPLLGLALDTLRKKLYVVYPLVPGLHGAAILNADSLSPLLVLGGDYEHRFNGLYDLAVNPATGNLWGFDRNREIVIDPELGTVTSTQRLVESIPRSEIAFESQGTRAYLLDSNRQVLETLGVAE